MHSLVVISADLGWDAAWSRLWGVVKSATGSQLTTLLTLIGVGLLIFAFVQWVWQRRNGGGMGGQGNSKLWGALIVGTLLSAPEILIPVFLKIAQWIVSIGLGLFA